MGICIVRKVRREYIYIASRLTFLFIVRSEDWKEGFGFVHSLLHYAFSVAIAFEFLSISLHPCSIRNIKIIIGKQSNLAMAH